MSENKSGFLGRIQTFLSGGEKNEPVENATKAHPLVRKIREQEQARDQDPESTTEEPSLLARIDKERDLKEEKNDPKDFDFDTAYDTATYEKRTEKPEESPTTEDAQSEDTRSEDAPSEDTPYDSDHLNRIFGRKSDTLTGGLRFGDKDSGWLGGSSNVGSESTQSDEKLSAQQQAVKDSHRKTQENLGKRYGKGIRKGD